MINTSFRTFTIFMERKVGTSLDNLPTTVISVEWGRPIREKETLKTWKNATFYVGKAKTNKNDKPKQNSFENFFFFFFFFLKIKVARKTKASGQLTAIRRNKNAETSQGRSLHELWKHHVTFFVSKFQPFPWKRSSVPWRDLMLLVRHYRTSRHAMSFLLKVLRATASFLTKNSPHGPNYWQKLIPDNFVRQISLSSLNYLKFRPNL